MGIYDLHTHIMPFIDDGASSTSETRTLIKVLKEQGVCGVIATPHFFARVKNVDEAVVYRNKILDKIGNVFSDDELKVAFGFEVRYFDGISTHPDINKLCLGKSDYILIELPYNRSITSRMIEELSALCLTRRLKPIIAHIERYTKVPGFSEILSLIRDGYVLSHVNTASLTNILLAGRTLKLIKSGVVSFITSDTHSSKKRPPKWDKALCVANKKLSKRTVEKLLNNAKKVFNEVYNA